MMPNENTAHKRRSPYRLGNFAIVPAHWEGRLPKGVVAAIHPADLQILVGSEDDGRGISSGRFAEGASSTRLPRTGSSIPPSYGRNLPFAVSLGGHSIQPGCSNLVWPAFTAAVVAERF